MATTPGRIFVAGSAALYLAPVGTAMPADARVALNVAFLEVGLFTPDSLTFATEPDFEDVESHQSFVPVRTIQTGDAATLSVALQEWSGKNFQAVYGGGTITEITVTVPSARTDYKFAPPQPGARTETAAIAQVIDGTKNYRLCIPRCIQREGVELELQRDTEATLALSLAVQGSGGGVDPYYWITDDAAFDIAP